MPGQTRKCHKCGEFFPKEEMIQKGEKNYWYCKSCLQESENYEAFAKEICKIFNIKAPGPVVNTKRAQLKKTYGYTDKVILNTFKYCHEVKGMKNLTTAFGTINPALVEEAKSYMSIQDAKQNNTLIAVTRVDYVEHKLPRRPAPEKNVGYDILEHLGDEEF